MITTDVTRRRPSDLASWFRPNTLFERTHLFWHDFTTKNATIGAVAEFVQARRIHLLDSHWDFRRNESQSFHRLRQREHRKRNPRPPFCYLPQIAATANTGSRVTIGAPSCSLVSSGMASTISLFAAMHPTSPSAEPTSSIRH